MMSGKACEVNSRCGISGCYGYSAKGSSFCPKHQPGMNGLSEGMGEETKVPEAPDMVNHPPHYNTGRFEVIDMIEDTLGGEGFEKYCIGTALKYLMRYEHKWNPLQDLEKAAWYLNKAIEKRKGRQGCVGRYYDRWFNLKFNEKIVRAKCIDIEFETGFGPRLLMESVYGNKFWLSRGELMDHKVQ